MTGNDDWDKGLEKLVTWQKAMNLAVTICKQVVPMLPPDERHALADQLRRSAQSIPANIAEGHGRYYYQEGIRFCYIARGSLEETRSHLIFACKMQYISSETYHAMNREIEELRRLLNGYILFLKKTKRGGDDQQLQPGIRETNESYETAMGEEDLFTS